MKKLLPFLMFWITHLVLAQSTDVVKLYVLYDVSGSTRVEDIHQNLKDLTSVLLREERDSSLSPFSIELIVFGESVEVKSLNLYKTDDIGKARADLIKYLDKINNRSSNSRVQKYTHLLEALKKVDVKSKESFGIFIFSDGQLKDGDVDGYDPFTYCDSIRARIRILQSNKKPVFVVQSSTSFVNDFYDIPKSFITSSDSVNISADFFWLRSNITYRRESSRSITQLFEKFLLQAFFRIQNSDDNKNPDDVIAKFLSLAEWLRIHELTEKIASLYKNEKGMVDGSRKLDSILTTFEQPVEIKPVEESKIVEKDIVRPKDQALEKTRQGGTKSVYDYPNDPFFIQPADPVLFKDLIKDIGARLNAAKSITSKDLEILYSEIKALVEDPRFFRLGEELERFKRNNAETMTLIAQNRKLELPNFLGAKAATLTYDHQLPFAEKSRNMQEALILGLTDYLINRTKQEALFSSLEYINANVFNPSSFIRDTLFFHTAKLFGTLDPNDDSHFEPNLVLIKEAFNQDMDLITKSLLMHPKVHSSDGLVALLYAAELIKNLSKGNTLEASFGKVKETLPVEGLSSSPLERGLLFTCHLIHFLEQHDLSIVYQQNSPETLSDFSKIIAIHIAKQYKDIHQINDIEAMAGKIKVIYLQYEGLKGQLEQYKNEVISLKPTGSFAEYQEYKRQLTIQILKECGDLLLSGVALAEHFVNIDAGEIKQSAYALATMSTTALECWFLVQDKKYAEAASHLIPMIPQLPIVKINLSNQFLSKFSNLRSSVNLLALKNDATNIVKTLQNSRIDFTRKVYIATSREDAIEFLTYNQLTFLTPLLLHMRDSLTSSGTKIPIWEIRFPDGLTVQSIENIYKSAISEFDNNSFKVKNLLAKIKNKGIESGWPDSTKEHVTMQLLSYFSIDGIDENLKKMIAIAGEISTAINANEVENVIEKYALPVASYRIKRTTVHSWMVNAYVGGGLTWYQKQDTVGFTLSAPVGIEHSWRFRNQRGSFSLFASIIDVGNVINYRLNESNESGKTFLLENVVSPGLYTILGLSKRFPLSLGLGYQVNPERASAFIAFDLPLFRLK